MAKPVIKLEPVKKESLKPGDFVLAKYASWQPWPSVAVADEHIENDPTIVKELKKEIKNKKIPYVYVFFFGDRNFGVVPENKVFKLTKEQAIEYAQLGGDRQGAFEELAEFEGYKEMLIETSTYKETDEIPMPDTLSGSSKTKQETNSSTTSTPGLKRKASIKKETNGGKKSKTTKSSARSTPKLDGEESDASKLEGIKSEESSADDSDDNLEKKFYKFRYNLQKKLLQRETPPDDATMREASEDLSGLEKNAQKMTKAILAQCKLHKVMKGIARVPALKRAEDFKFHERAERLALQWQDLIEELRIEKHGDTPNTSVAAEENLEAKNEVASTKSQKVKDEETNTPVVESKGDDVTTKDDTLKDETLNTVVTNGDTVVADA